MSRPRKTDRLLSAVISFRVPADVAEAWKQAASDRCLGLGDWIRQSVDPNAVKVTGKVRVNVKGRHYSPVDPSLLAAVIRVTVPLNQIARRLGQLGVSGDRIDFHTCLNQLANIERIVAELAAPESVQSEHPTP